MLVQITAVDYGNTDSDKEKVVVFPLGAMHSASRKK